MTRARVSCYTRKGCHLCDDALALLRHIQQQHPFDLEVLDLDQQASAEKHAAYNLEVPVVELNDRKVMKYRVDEARLVRLLESLDEPRAIEPT